MFNALNLMAVSVVHLCFITCKSLVIYYNLTLISNKDTLCLNLLKSTYENLDVARKLNAELLN